MYVTVSLVIVQDAMLKITEFGVYGHVDGRATAFARMLMCRCLVSDVSECAYSPIGGYNEPGYTA